MKLGLKKWIYGLPEYVAGRTIEEIKQKYGLAEVYKLASNENLFGPSKKVKETLAKSLDALNYYPDSDALEIREKIAAKYNISPSNVIMGNGTDQIIEMICDCFISLEDKVVIADPNFLIYEKSSCKCGGGAIKVPLLPDFRQDILSMLKAADADTRIFFIASPHNPSGTIITRQEFELMLEKIPPDTLLVMDEAYYEYLPSENSFDTVSYLAKHPNLIILRTFSKIYGLAGLRIGYGLAGGEVISGLNRIRLPFNISSIAQKAAIAALNDASYVEHIRGLVFKEKEKFYKFLEKEKINYVTTYANFILIETGKHSLQIVESLLKEGFIVRPGENLGIPGYIRVTFATPEIDDKFIAHFNRIYREYYH